MPKRGHPECNALRLYCGKSPKAGLLPYSIELTQREARSAVRRALSPAKGSLVDWKYCYQGGWRIVAVEIREARRGVR